MPSCPHCEKDLGSGFTTQDALEGRLARQKDKFKAESDVLRTQLQEAQSQLKDASKAAKSTAELQAQVAELQGKLDAQAQAVVLQDSGLDASYHDNALALWRFANEGAEEGKALSLADWLAGPARDGVLAAVLPGTGPVGGEEAPEAPGATQPTATVQGPRSGRDTYRSPPRTQRRRTPQEVRAILQSPEFNRLPRDEQIKRMDALEAEVRG